MNEIKSLGSTYRIIALSDSVFPRSGKDKRQDYKRSSDSVAGRELGLVLSQMLLDGLLIVREVVQVRGHHSLIVRGADLLLLVDGVDDIFQLTVDSVEAPGVSALHISLEKSD